MIATTNSDELNMLCCLIAKKAGNCHTIARIRNPEYSAEIGYIREELNLSMAINPELAAAREIARLLRFPSAIKIGQNMGQHLTEKVYHGDIIVLKGDVNDFNTPFLYYGAMKYIKPLIENGKLNMVLDAYVPKWSPAEAKKLVKEAVAANGNRIDAIFASNDRLAGAAAEALEELHVTNHAVITGMDAELAAIKRILAGTQDATIYMDLRELAYAAVDEAYNLATKKKVNVNSELGNDGSNKINAFLINGKVVTRENINKVLIEPGHFTKEDIYSE